MDIRHMLQVVPNTPRLERELLLAHVLQKPREFLIAHPELEISNIEKIKYKYLLWKLKRGYPLAYLIGHREFYGLDFLVNKHTLIPRPETELMVELASEEIRRLEDQKIILIDIGTGSGCIPISIMKTLSNVILIRHLAEKDPVDSTPGSFGLRPQDDVLQVFATDISKYALRVAKKNAKKHNTNITFLHGNLLKPFLKQHGKQLEISNLKLVITSNLPYLTQKQFDNEVSIQKEPRSALVADDNGLALYKELLEQIKLLITSYQLPHFAKATRGTPASPKLQRGEPITLFMEIDPTQKEPLMDYCQKQFVRGKIETHIDLLGSARIISLTIS